MLACVCVGMAYAYVEIEDCTYYDGRRMGAYLCFVCLTNVWLIINVCVFV